MNEEEQDTQAISKIIQTLFKETVIRYKEKYIPQVAINHPIFIKDLATFIPKFQIPYHYAKLQIIVIFLNHIVQIYLFAT